MGIDLTPHSFLWGEFEKTTPVLPRGPQWWLPADHVTYTSEPEFFPTTTSWCSWRIPEVTHRMHPAGGWPETSELISYLEGKPLGRKE